MAVALIRHGGTGRNDPFCEKKGDYLSRPVHRSWVQTDALAL